MDIKFDSSGFKYHEIISEPPDSNTIYFEDGMNLFISNQENLDFNLQNRNNNILIFPYDFDIFPSSPDEVVTHDIKTIKKAILEKLIKNIDYYIFKLYLKEQTEINKNLSNFIPIIRVCDCKVKTNFGMGSYIDIPWSIVGVTDKMYADLLLRKNLQEI